MQEINKNPLVSVIVVTYNSSLYIKDTLESIKAQTYNNIELIITDDHSKDQTIEICEDWCKKNKQRFVNLHLITSDKNTGIAPNFNRGIQKVKGDWIKIIGGDDAFYPEILENYISYICQHPDVKFLHSRAVNYLETFEEENRLPSLDEAAKLRINKPKITPREQFSILLRTSNIAALTVMIKRDVFEEVGLFDERYPMWEDTPMWLKITKNNINLVYLDILGGKYRVRSNSVIRTNKNDKILSDFSIYRSRAYKEVCLPYISGFEYFIKITALKLNELFYKLNNNSIWVKAFYKISTYPLMFVINKINKSYKY